MAELRSIKGSGFHGRIGTIAFSLILFTSSFVGGERRASAAGEDEDLAFYLGQRGSVVQADMRGRVLRTVDTPGKVYDLAASRDGLFLALGDKGLARIRPDGTFEKIRSNPRECIIAVAVAPKSQDLFVADNARDVILRYPGGVPVSGEQGKNDKRPDVLFSEIGSEERLDSMRLAVDRQGRVLFSSKGGSLYRLHEGQEGSLKSSSIRPFEPSDVASPHAMTFEMHCGFPGLAADPTSHCWIATCHRRGLFLFEGDVMSEMIPYPKRESPTFAPDPLYSPAGRPFLLMKGKMYEIRWETKELHLLFDCQGSGRAAIGPRFSWTQ